MTNEETPATFATWGDLDLMGHKHLSGRIEEVTLFGASMVKFTHIADDGSPGAVEYYSPAAVYSITPRTLEDLRQEARERHAWMVKQRQAYAPPQIGPMEDEEPEGTDGSAEGLAGGVEEPPDENVVETTVRSYPFSETRRRIFRDWATTEDAADKGPRYISQGHIDKPGRVVTDQKTGEQMGPVHLNPATALRTAANLTSRGRCIMPGCANARAEGGVLCEMEMVLTPEEGYGKRNELADLFMAGSITSEEYDAACEQIGHGRR